jgi:hypothetical protein
MADDGFSVENLRIKNLPPLEPGVARQRRRSREFVMMSREQSDRLDKAVNSGTERVFRHLLFLTWRSPDKPVVLANAELARKGIDRQTKRRTLLELEVLGLIRVEWRYKKSPIVTVLCG